MPSAASVRHDVWRLSRRFTKRSSMGKQLKLALNTGYWAGGPPDDAVERIAEAERLGLEVNMNDDAGWNGSGGPATICRTSCTVRMRQRCSSTKSSTFGFLRRRRRHAST